MSNEDLKVRAMNGWNNLMLTMGKKFGLPKGFGIEIGPPLRDWFESGDPKNLQKFIDWVENTIADMK